MGYHNIKIFFHTYEQVVKQVANKFGKQVDCTLLTDDIFIPDDYEPFFNSLVHVLRNAVDHGIESYETKRIIGKNKQSTVICSAILIKSNLIISIEDNGQGIDLENLKKSLVKKNIYTIDIVETFDEEKLIDSVFIDNISTANEISEISGMGIGLSAVKDELLKLGGRYHIETKKGEGTKFTFTIPYKI